MHQAKEECGGLKRGVCNRETGNKIRSTNFVFFPILGTCMCSSRFASSDGDENQGGRGDCGYYYSGILSSEVKADSGGFF